MPSVPTLRLRRKRRPGAVSPIRKSPIGRLAQVARPAFSRFEEGFFTMSDVIQFRHYAITSLLCLVVALIGSPLSIFLAVRVDSDLLRAVYLLVGPSAFVLWVVTGIRALHLLGLRYWQLPSTYVALGSTLAAVVALIIASAANSSGSTIVFNSTMGYVAALIIGASACWCFWYNWRRTGSIAISFTVSAMQLFAAAAVVVLLLGRFRDQTKDRD